MVFPAKSRKQGLGKDKHFTCDKHIAVCALLHPLHRRRRGERVPAARAAPARYAARAGRVGPLVTACMGHSVRGSRP